ncbi:hypothetical protein KZ483_15270 [Paenibacillus sp. sptzw28]|uniref:hypothetical protein n=1 Tax=Paenibacillus sp. sptzw28 TaxID=715179 RepID=UPI001C6DDCB4|nr:hypothetical protein [Paenibacillus sp. sptzw28]QYR19299.1 hypothetical protein KZ483_15270 [Paenibacillus sp. sptzw28]
MTRTAGYEAAAGDIANIHQRLNLWTGILTSEYTVQGVPVRVTTACHSVYDTVGVRVESPLISQGRLQVFIRFPAPDMIHTAWAKAVFPDWDNDDRHRTVLLEQEAQRALLDRSMDEDHYLVGWEWSSGRIERTGLHENTYLTNGHNYQRPGLTAYLPGNGGLLTAAAMMACGWKGSGQVFRRMEGGT